MITYNRDDKILSNIAEKFEARLKESADLTLVLDESLGELDGRIENGTISAGSYGQLLYVLGEYLRNPQTAEGSYHSEKEICAAYFCTHFNNYIDSAPLEELYDYIDDLAFWGMNALQLWFDLHHFVNMEGGREKSDRLKKIMSYAKTIGVKTILNLVANEAFAASPKELRADWTGGHDGYILDLNDHYHLEICPSKPGGIEQIKEYRRQMLEVFAEVKPDYINIMGYDQGGCTCTDCAPWGCNGYIRSCEAIIPLIKEYLPEAEIIFSLWQFGTFTGNEVEFEGLKKELEAGRLPEVKYLVSEPQYARYPFEHSMPRPVIGFPEISMFHAFPWGGYGANPMPKLLEELWKENGSKLAGGTPYSEGLYTDVNEIIMLRLYRANQAPAETIKEYLAYEFGLTGETLEKAADAVVAMEETLEREFDKKAHRYAIVHPEKIAQIEKDILEAHEQLSPEMQQNKKWQMIYLRAVIDGELLRNNFTRNEKVLEYFNRIVELEYLQKSGMYTKPDVYVGNVK